MYMQMNPKERLGYVILGVLVLAILGVLGWRTSAPPRHFESIGLAPTSKVSGTRLPAVKDNSPLVVHVVGAVKSPGVYKLPPNSRAQDAVHAAGGPVSDADMAGINLAQHLVDGQQVRVPSKSSSNPSASFSPGKGKDKIVSGTISLNSASAEELQRLPGIGPSTAQKIVQFRSTHGAFSSIEQLREIGGIGDAKLERLRPFLSL